MSGSPFPSPSPPVPPSVPVALHLTINGRPVSVEIDARTLLVQVLRETMGLTGTHVGCETSQCGACTVLVDGRAVKACALFAVQAEGAAVTTIEGLAGADGGLHPMQAAFRDHHGLQCGFCTSGMVLAAVALVADHPDPDEETVRAGLEGNLCRCTGYEPIVAAVRAGARAMGRDGTEDGRGGSGLVPK